MTNCAKIHEYVGGFPQIRRIEKRSNTSVPLATK